MGEYVVNTHIKAFNALVDQYQAAQSEYSRKLSEIDKKEQDLLHMLELEQLNAVKLVKIAKKLQEIRRERRHIKFEEQELTAISCKLGKKFKLKSGKLDGDYNTDIVQEILN